MASGNRLSGETSPYLLQHAGNPVDWYPWGEDAFARARADDKPIFLSVGYAACHWCHVMEWESFEDDDTAAMLNGGFVSIKVDREERPDVDAIYMDAVQSMTGSGGWPMSVFLTHDGKPFYAGTYFPNEPRHGMPSFRQVLAGISDAWRTRRTDVEEQGDHVARAIEQAITSAEQTPMSVGIADDAFSAVLRSFDPRHGGFGGAPKFPQPMVLEWLLRQAVRGRPQAREMVVVTLDRMAAGGLQDQVGGGFARYSTDTSWHVPHFEKMLPDNAQLLQLYANAWLFTREERYRDVAVRTADYLLREMQQPNGGFSTSQDADSEGVEGKFFVWGWEELVAAVGQPIAEAFGAVPGGNWEGTNVLWLPAPLDEIARRYEIDGASLRTDVDEARATLFKVREHRAAPAVDDKVIVGWNGLAIRALAVAGRSMDVARYVEAALACATFTWDSMRDADGRLLRSWRAGTARVPAFLDDHALLGLGLITLYETTGDVSWFERAGTLAEQILDLFSDPAGGFYLAAHDAEPLVVRPKELLDTAVPSGNSAAAELLLRLSLYTGERRFEDAAARAIELVMEPARRHPSAFGHALNVADLALGPVAEIAIVGHHGSDQRAELIREVVGRYLPNTVLAVGTGAAGAEPVPLLRDKPALDGQAMAYVCERFACQAPVVDPLALRLQLGSTS